MASGRIVVVSVSAVLPVCRFLAFSWVLTGIAKFSPDSFNDWRGLGPKFRRRLRYDLGVLISYIKAKRPLAIRSRRVQYRYCNKAYRGGCHKALIR